MHRPPLHQRLAWASFAALLAFLVVENRFALASETLSEVLYNIALVVPGVFCIWRAIQVRKERLVWVLIGSGALCWAAANIYWSLALARLETQPYPSVADALWLAFYPPVFIGLGLLVRLRLGHFPLVAWLDGLIASFAIAAVGIGVLLPPILASTGGDTAAVATNLAYPLADITLLALVVATVTNLVEADDLATKAAKALTESGERFVIGASFGTAVIPDEATSASNALRLADGRMYAQKAGRPSAFNQVRAALVTALEEHDHVLSNHGDDVAVLAEAVGRRFSLRTDELDDLRTAGELHDIGKLGIPEAILNKPGPLTDDEWEFIRQHPVIGERILASTPSLAPLAPIIRAAHERWDGTGYPDQLAGKSIPLAARIIFACDAYDAMTTSGRPYRAPMTSEAAISELQRLAGTQFDPEVVDALVAEVGLTSTSASERPQASGRLVVLAA